MPAVASYKMFPLVIDLYYQIDALAADGSFAPTYPTVPDKRRMPCSISYKRQTRQAMDRSEFDRIMQTRDYVILTPTDPLLRPRDKILYVDLSKVTHELFVDSCDDTDGLGIHWTVLASEKV